MNSAELFVETVAVKPALVVLLAAVLAVGLRRQAAAARHVVWAGAVIASLGLPLLAVIVPPVIVRLPSPAAGESAAVQSASQSSPSVGADGTGEPRPFAGRAWDAGGVAVANALAVVWLLVALLLAGGRVVAELRVRRLIARAHPVANVATAALFARMRARSGVSETIELRVSDDVASPVIAGVARAAVLIPRAAEVWPDADLAAVFAHELAHASRGDNLMNLLGDVAAALYWCNPAVRLAVRRMRAESERACDDRVLRCGTGAAEYATVLLRVAASIRQTSRPAAPAIPMIRRRELESRLRAILDPRVTRHPLTRRRAFASGCAIALITVPTAALTSAPRLSGQEAPEPDRRGDWLAAPASERLPLATRSFQAPPGATAALAGPDSALVRRLIGALAQTPRHDADLVRERAAWALAQARDGHIVEPLLGALRSDDWRVQSYATWALATARDPRAGPPLLALLEHPVWRARAMAAYALRLAGDPRAEARMLRALADPAWQVRVEAVGYFAGRGGPDLGDLLAPRLADRHVAVRTAAQRALHRSP